MKRDRAEGMTATLVETVRGLRYDDLPDETREVGRHCVLDWLGVTIAGAREPLVEILVDALVGAESSDQAPLVGRDERATAATAALVSGAAGHALDYDDAHMRMNGHPTAPVLPALLALPGAGGVDGKALLTAFVAGVELECRLGAILGAGHYEIGFHATGTLGTFGAAAACAHLLGLGPQAWQHTMGLAATQAAGLKSAFGTMAKPLHAGRAASNGLVSALLARGGFTSAAGVVEAPQGFAATHAGAVPDVGILEGLRDRFLIRDTLFKYHAACYLTHAPIEAARRLREKHGIDPQAVEAVELKVAPLLLGVCNLAEPRTGLEGKFSLRATTALAFLGEDTGALGTYCEAKMADARLARLRDRTRVLTDASRAPTQASVAVTVAGRRFEEKADSGVPATDLAEQRRRLREKFAALVVPVLGAEAAADLAEAALSVDRLVSVDALLRRAARSAAA